MLRIPAVALAVPILVAQARAETMPAVLRPPSSATFVGRFRAAGVQIYRCDPAGKTWGLEAPEAVLSDDAATQRIHHFAGPSWQAGDGSKVVGKLVAQAPALVSGAIPWLLVATTSVGPGFLAGVRFVQRLDTKGGSAPAGACKAGEAVRVPYFATYSFYR